MTAARVYARAAAVCFVILAGVMLAELIAERLDPPEPRYLVTVEGDR